jgi:hypothetical protein
VVGTAPQRENGRRASRSQQKHHQERHDEPAGASSGPVRERIMCTACGDVLTRHWQGHLLACWLLLDPPEKRRQGMVLPTQGAGVEGLPTVASTYVR